MIKQIALTAASMALFAGCSFVTPTQNDSAKEGASISNKENIYAQDGVLQDYLNNKNANEERKDKNFGSFFKKYMNTRAGRDCSGFVSIVNQKHANMYFDEKTINKYYDKGGRKSKAIYNFYQSQNLIIQENPKIGDLIFFSNTLGKGVQKNIDKQNVTHVGIVNEISPDGTIRFIHNSGGKIIHSYMNLNNKNTHLNGKKEINSYIIRCSKISCLASNRFAGYGKVK